MNFRIGEFVSHRISVEDVPANRDWFISFLGKEPLADLDGFVSFRLGNATLDLCRADAKSPPSNEGTVGYWFVTGLEEALAHAQSLGGSIYRGPLRVAETRSTIVQVRNPFGTVFGLEEPFA